MIKPASEFKAVVEDTVWRDRLYRFLQVIFHLYPEDKFHYLICEETAKGQSDEAIYRAIQKGLPGIKPFLSELTYALPALSKQKKEMARQVQSILGSRSVSGYLEIGSTGRYAKALAKLVPLRGELWLTNDLVPDYSLAEIFERGQIPKLGRFFPLDDYAPIPESVLADSSLDLVACHIGLHHCRPEKLEGYMDSIRRVLRPGGIFVLRDHDVRTPEMDVFVSLVHTVFNIGLGVSWETEAADYKGFRSAEAWSGFVCGKGFEDMGFRILQANDPSDNTLMGFVKS